MTAPEPDAAGAPAHHPRGLRPRTRAARSRMGGQARQRGLSKSPHERARHGGSRHARRERPARRPHCGGGRGRLRPRRALSLFRHRPSRPHGRVRQEDESCQTALATFTTRLWELGLTVGASVRSTSEFLSEAAEDISIATTYLESRCLWGNGRLYAQARMHFAQTLDPRRFFRDKMLELARRHQKFEDTPYSLEPNIKGEPRRPSRPAGLSLVRPGRRHCTVRLRHGLRRPHHRARDAYARRLRTPSRVASHHAASAHTPSGKPSALRRAGGACERTRLTAPRHS